MTAFPAAPDRVAPRAAGDGAAVSRIDLHLHSRASGPASNWWVRAIGMGTEVLESYTAPEAARALAKDAGMDFVALTDHETIDGALAIAHHPDVLVGVEVSTRFPEDGTSADVLVYGLDGGHLAELQRLRPNAAGLVGFLREAGLPYVLAHPMFEMHAPLDRAAVERRMALFPLWEFVNGSRPADQNRLAAVVAAGAGDLRLLAARHGLPAPRHRRIAGTAGSDDHGGLYPGAAHTVMPRVTSPADAVAALLAGAVRPAGADGSPATMAGTGLRLAGHAAANKASHRTESPVAEADDDEPAVLKHLPLLAALPPGLARRALAGRYESRVKDAAAAIAAGSLPGLLAQAGRVVEAHALLAPFVAVHAYWGGERRKAAALGERLGLAGGGAPRVGLFVDGFGAVHGVSTFYRNVLSQDSQPIEPALHLVRCDDEPGADLRPVAHLPMPLYDAPPLPIPSLLDVLDLVAERGFDILHVATPGPLGLSAMAAAQVLGLPVVGGYHTEFGNYARVLGADRMLGDVVEAAVRAFYGRCAVVAAPSATTARSLRQRGYPIGRIEVLGNGVDADVFHPTRRDERLRRELGGGRVLLAFAGRISQEKGLEELVRGFRALSAKRDDAHVVVIGDGPYRQRMERELGPAATFTGFLHGDAYARTLASCDVLLFPSETDTLGRAVIEAQACGLPAVVKDGGPAECVIPGESGLVAALGDETGFWDSVEALLDDPDRRTRMGEAARAFAAGRTWRSVRAGLGGMYRDLAPRADFADRRDRDASHGLAAAAAGDSGGRRTG